MSLQSARRLIEFAQGQGLLPPASELDRFTRAFIEAMLVDVNEALRDDSSEEGESFVDKTYDLADIAPATWQKIVAECREFQARNAEAIEQGGTKFNDAYDQAGYDFYHTRQGSGVGFWETDDWPEPWGPQLDKAAKAYKEVDAYIGDDGLVYVMGGEGDWQLKKAGGLIQNVAVRDPETQKNDDAPTFSVNDEDDEDWGEPEAWKESAEDIVDRLIEGEEKT